VSGALMDLYRFDGVETVDDVRERYILNGVGYMHGYARMGSHARAWGRPIVHGHDHAPALVHIRDMDRVYWEASSGFCAELDAPCFNYLKMKQLAKWALACLEVVGDTEPTFFFDQQQIGGGV